MDRITTPPLSRCLFCATGQLCRACDDSPRWSSIRGARTCADEGATVMAQQREREREGRMRERELKPCVAESGRNTGVPERQVRNTDRQ